jgi:hypothetical protein
MALLACDCKFDGGSTIHLEGLSPRLGSPCRREVQCDRGIRKLECCYSCYNDIYIVIIGFRI